MADAVTFDDGLLGAGYLSDDELTALALAADPDAALGDDAVCLWDLIGAGDGTGDGTSTTGGCGPALPAWYMPAPMAGARPLRRPWHRRVAVLVIASFLVIDCLGLCVTYGQLVVA